MDWMHFNIHNQCSETHPNLHEDFQVLNKLVLKTDLQPLHHTHRIIKTHIADSLIPQIASLPPFYHISPLEASTDRAVTVVQPDN